MSVAVVPTGTANVASVLAAFTRAGMMAELANEPSRVATATRVVVPGVGSFGAATHSLSTSDFMEPLVRRIQEGRATLMVCVGMQVLAEASDETPGARGLGVIPHHVRRFSGDVPVPQLWWNLVVPAAESRYVRRGWAYFANSFRLNDIPEGWTGSVASYGGEFVAALEKGDVLACQFHPELSGRWGADLLERWLDSTGGKAR